ncbi:Fibronectin-attachment protein (FAP) [Methylorubrum aminovorans]
MTNRYMVKRSLMAKPASANGVSSLPEPNRSPLPAMPAPEDSLTPTTNEEPVDSPQPNASAKRGPPGSGELGLSTRRES